MAHRYVCVFDVNETLLDLSALDSHFQRVFGDATARQAWFTQVLQSAMTTTIAGPYLNFADVGAGALHMIAKRRQVTVSPEDAEKILRGMRTLPPHGEVLDALQFLRNKGVHLAALTNSTLQVAEEQLNNAGLIGVFDRILSADTAQRLKPAPEAYRTAASSLDIPIDRMLLVAAHAWDVAGAMRVGASAAFVARPGMVLDPLHPHPLVVGRDLQEVAEGILRAPEPSLP